MTDSAATIGGTRRRPGRPVGGQPLASRKQLLEASASLIERRGPDVTMEEIAAEADVTKPVLYREIGDRAALVSALAEILINRITEAVGDAVVGNVEPRAQLEAAVAGYLSAVDAHRHLFLFVIAGRQRPDEVRHLVEQSATAMIKLFESAPGIATSTQARTWAYSIVGVFHTVTTMWLGDQYCDRDQLAADLSALLWPALEFAGK